MEAESRSFKSSRSVVSNFRAPILATRANYGVSESDARSCQNGAMRANLGTREFGVSGNDFLVNARWSVVRNFLRGTDVPKNGCAPQKAVYVLCVGKLVVGNYMYSG